MKTIVVECFALFESDGGGMSGNLEGYAANMVVATQWKNLSNGYRSVLPYNKTFNIIESIEELAELKNAKLRESALAKLNQAEKVALGLA